MKMRSALIAHPYPIVVEALATIVAGAGFAVVRAGDAAATRAGLEAMPDLAVVAASFDGERAGARGGAGRTLIIADGDSDADDVIALTAPVARHAATIAGAAGEPALAPVLTPRERDVARLVAAGQRNRLIATTLGISEGTVKMHLHNVYAKLGLQSRTQLAMSAGALGAR